MLYLFTLGRTSSLCFAELEAILKTLKINYKITSVTLNHAIVETENEIDALKILRESGGIIKISCFLTVIPAQAGIQVLSMDKLRLIHTNSGEYKNFGVSLIGFKDNIQKICEEFKKEIKLHFCLPKSGFELSSAQISNGNTLEIIILKIKGEFQVFQTICVQDIDYWTKKDVGRPHIDDRLGMLPLKVARMMINLGLSHFVIPAPRPSVAFNEGGKAGIHDLDSGFRQNDIVLLDPFCGMGSILAEAVDLGFKDVIGGDINAGVLQKADDNFKWFINEFSCEHVNTLMINSDATKIAEKLQDKVDLIVTEPFLGDARKLKILSNTNQKNFFPHTVIPAKAGILKSKLKIPDRAALVRNDNRGNTNQIPKNIELEVKNIIKGLGKMYTGCLKEWRGILKENGTVCIIVPEIEIGEKTFKLPFVEICEKTGYNVIDSFDYSREKAIVKRKIFLLKLTK